VLVSLAVGCASPEYRIRKHPELFASFPPEVQENVAAGKIEIGYDPDMVFIAMGRPDHTYSRQTESGLTLIWAYSTRHHTTSWRPVETLHVYRDKHGQRRYASRTTWIDVNEYTEVEAVRIEFSDEKVKAIEVLNR